MAEYDPLNYHTWPEEQREFAGRVTYALRDGDAKPLADYLRAGFALEPTMAAEIADMIEGVEWSRYRLVMKAARPGELGRSASMDNYDRKMRIGVFMEDRLRQYGRGGYDSAMRDTMEKFGIKSSATIAKALKHLREHMKRSKSAPGWDQWEHLKQFYFTP